ncbi:unnamed protein product (macronuclear) [Paramecium tetraurelia]|uniref:Mitochondrial import inner membrane translocase subunit TIM50 n=1 Tax=Paramecium tetraurelia TaxID=5888 RepID=A0EAW3_PARTE|nr:uncharacterized protein GSPATT00025164001 [Paramecium tetraurelia]CAK92430.1 unnamed protein product [Paramecium tetraurelia]|eukprot:XP_001459827.1 hypothetical protein (macronuclear) [Paramecium tetraurelia strain d4-2]
MRKNQTTIKTRPARAISQAKDPRESQFPIIEQKQAKPSSVIRSSKKSLDFNRLIKNPRLNDSRLEEALEADLSFKKMELKDNRLQKGSPQKPNLQLISETSQAENEQRASTPPRKNRKEGQDFNARSESFATLEPMHHAEETLAENLRIFIKIYEIMNYLLNSMKKNTTLELINQINQYMELTEDTGFQYLEELLQEHAKQVRQIFLILRVGIVVLVNCFFDLHFYLSSMSNIKNILLYNIQNLSHLSDILLEKLKEKTRISSIFIVVFLIVIQHQQENHCHQKARLLDLHQVEHRIITKSLQIPYKKVRRDLYQFLIIFLRSLQNYTIKESLRNLQEFISFYFTIQQSYQGLLGIPLICVAPQPYLPYTNPKTYTLVLDMDETLIHFTDQTGHFLIRPFTHQFLQEMSQFYELVVFTAGLPDYANWVLDQVDKNKNISYRLFRQHALQYSNQFIKDLSRLGRDLSKCIIVDNVPDNFQNQPENGIFIKTWYSDQNDTALAELGPILKSIVMKKAEDVRLALKEVRKMLTQSIQLPPLQG